MRLVLKPLFEAELPAGFEEIIREKLTGKEVRTGETVDIDLLGKPLRFKVLLADPSPSKVSRTARIELSTSKINEVTLEFERDVSDSIPFEGGFVIILGNEVRILNRNGQKVYSREFENLKKVRAAEGRVVIVHGNKVTVVEP